MIGRVVKEQFSPLDTTFISQTARHLPDDQAYEFLADWVLPSETHETLRLYYQHEPYQQGEDDATSAGRDEMLAIDIGAVIGPAVELINLASQIGKLDEVAGRVNAIVPVDTASERARLAMPSLLQIAQEQDDEALESLRQLNDKLAEGVDSSRRPHLAAPEVIAARAASRRPSLTLVAVDLAERLVEEARESERSHEWKLLVNDLLGEVPRQLAGRTTSLRSSNEKLTQWSSVPYVHPKDRYLDRRPSQWQ